MQLGIPGQGESGFPGKRGGARPASRDIEYSGPFMEEFGYLSGRACFGSRCLGFLGRDNMLRWDLVDRANWRDCVVRDMGGGVEFWGRLRPSRNAERRFVMKPYR